ncbi:hypothetical protein IFM89_007596 [Coptis chinensis]|uniref:Glucosidase II beta subunit N-terminal domain-containing protein n=1 Tax=Coptis chinensis TaxID=261450 RepID=A0A835GX47_9MAGN|nr:hypothetical protein IFM89_007596 [Coptis chinensis]
MEYSRRNVLLISLLLVAIITPSSLTTISPLYGIHPQDEKYYLSKQLIKCKDGSKYFTKSRLNDNFCDCIDGTDEPGTSACPAGRFYCRNDGSRPQLLFSSRVNDHLCDCCDGSDEYDGGIICLNTCYKDVKVSDNVNNDTMQKSNRVSLEDFVEKLKELKIVVFLEVAFILMAFRLFHRGMRSRRRWFP